MFQGVGLVGSDSLTQVCEAYCERIVEKICANKNRMRLSSIRETDKQAGTYPMFLFVSYSLERIYNPL